MRKVRAAKPRRHSAALKRHLRGGACQAPGRRPFHARVLPRPCGCKCTRCIHIERGGEEQIAGELEAYNPLIPRGDALIATLMLEIDDPTRRERELYRLAGIEDTIRLEIGGTAVAAQPIEDEVARTSEDGKTVLDSFSEHAGHLSPPVGGRSVLHAGLRASNWVRRSTPRLRPPRHLVGGSTRAALARRRLDRGRPASSAAPRTFPAVRATGGRTPDRGAFSGTQPSHRLGERSMRHQPILAAEKMRIDIQTPADGPQHPPAPRSTGAPAWSAPRP